MLDLTQLNNSRNVKRKSVLVTNQFGNTQQYCEDESEVYSDMINLHLQQDKEVKQYDVLPIRRESMDSLLTACQNGVVLCKLINCAVPGTINTKAINIKEKLNIYQINENLRLAINSAKAIGCIVNLSTDMIYHK